MTTETIIYETGQLTEPLHAGEHVQLDYICPHCERAASTAGRRHPGDVRVVQCVWCRGWTRVFEPAGEDS